MSVLALALISSPLLKSTFLQPQKLTNLSLPRILISSKRVFVYPKCEYDQKKLQLKERNVIMPPRLGQRICFYDPNAPYHNPRLVTYDYLGNDEELQAFYEKYRFRGDSTHADIADQIPTGLQTPMGSDVDDMVDIQGFAVPGQMSPAEPGMLRFADLQSEGSTATPQTPEYHHDGYGFRQTSDPFLPHSSSSFEAAYGDVSNSISSRPAHQGRVLRSQAATLTQHYELNQRSKFSCVRGVKSDYREHRLGPQLDPLDPHYDPHEAYRNSPEVRCEAQPDPWQWERPPWEVPRRGEPMVPVGVDPRKWLETIQRNKASRRRHRETIVELKKRFGCEPSTAESKKKGKATIKGNRGGPTGSKITKTRSRPRRTCRS